MAGAFIHSNHYQILVKVEGGIKVPQEDCSQSVLVGTVGDRLDPQKAVISLSAQMVQVPPGLDYNLRILKREFNILHLIIEVIACLSGDQNLLSVDFVRVN